MTARQRWDAGKPEAWRSGATGGVPTSPGAPPESRWGSGVEEEAAEPKGRGRWGDDAPNGDRRRYDDGECP